MKIVFFGSSHNVIPIIDVLKETSDLKLVVTTDNSGSSYIRLVGFVDSYCRLNKIPFTCSLEINDKLINVIKKLKPDLGVVANFGVILPEKLIKIFPKGILNIHPSLLPKYRGPTPVQSAILNGEIKTGVTLIKIDSKIDHGPIIDREEFKLKPSDNSQKALYELFEKGAVLLRKNLNDYFTGNIKPKPQNHAQATFTRVLKREDGFVNVSKFPSFEKLDRMIRAYFPWPGVWTRLRLSSGGQAKIIKFLPNKQIQVEGKKEMSYKDFLNGYPEADSKLRRYLETNV